MNLINRGILLEKEKSQGILSQHGYVHVYLGDICPNCRSYNIEVRGRPHPRGPDIIYQQVHCIECTRSWTETYVLAGFNLEKEDEDTEE